MENVLGTCSICGGRVIAPGMHIDPMAAVHCERCGAKPKIPFRPVIDMEPAGNWGKKENIIKWTAPKGTRIAKYEHRSLDLWDSICQ